MTLFEKPEDTEYSVLVAENSFIIDIQFAIEAALDAKSLSQADLAKLLNVSEARVSQIMSGNGKNLQARTIARIAHALDMRPWIDFLDGVDAEWERHAVEAIPNGQFSEWARRAIEMLDQQGEFRLAASNDEWEPSSDAGQTNRAPSREPVAA